MNELIMIARDMQRLRLEAMVRRVLDTLRDTIQLEREEPPRMGPPPDPAVRRQQIFAPDVDVSDIRVHFTDASVRVIAPLVEKADLLGALQPKHLAALRTIILDYIGKPGYLEEFHRIGPGDTVTIEELMLLIHTTADHAEMVEARS